MSKTTPVIFTKLLPYLIFSIPTVFYFYEFFVQISPSVMTHELMCDLRLNAATLGIISAIYYYAYTPMQIIAGMLYDRFNIRIIIFCAILVCALGTLSFSFANHLETALISRFAIGGASAFAFTGALVLASRWFSAHQFAFLVGIAELMGSLGAVIGESPLANLVTTYGWRDTLLIVSFIGFVLAFIAIMIIKNPPSFQKDHPEYKKPTSTTSSLKIVCHNKQTWFVALYAFCSWMPMTVLAALWGVPYLMIRYQISSTLASSATTMMWLGVALGCPFIGWWSDYLRRRNLPLSTFSLIGLIAIIGIVYIPKLPFAFIYLLLFMIGISASGQSLSFAVVKDNNQQHTIGTAMGLNNMAVVAGGALFQPLVGVLLHWSWNGEIVNNVPVYTLSNYQQAFTILIPCYVLGFIISTFLIKETHCEPLHP